MCGDHKNSGGDDDASAKLRNRDKSVTDHEIDFDVDHELPGETKGSSRAAVGIRTGCPEEEERENVDDCPVEPMENDDGDLAVPFDECEFKVVSQTFAPLFGGDVYLSSSVSVEVSGCSPCDCHGVCSCEDQLQRGESSASLFCGEGLGSRCSSCGCPSSPHVGRTSLLCGGVMERCSSARGGCFPRVIFDPGGCSLRRRVLSSRMPNLTQFALSCEAN